MINIPKPLIELSRELQQRGVGLVVLDQGIDTTTAVGRMFFQILDAVAVPKLGPRQVQLAREMYDSGDCTVQQIADEFGVTRPTIYRHLGKTATP